ncbi:hypothetical protein WJX82_005172 [Trebouxia sp. C0006]
MAHVRPNFELPSAYTLRESLSAMIIDEIDRWGPQKCMMHAFSTTMASVMGHKHATGLITRAQKLVTFFRASHQPLALLKKLAERLARNC